MRLVSMTVDGRASYGIVEGDSVVDCGAVLRDRHADLKAVLAAGAIQALATAGPAPARPLAGVTLVPVIPNPDKIICVGVNYVLHREETGRAEASRPTLFTRFANTLTGHGSALLLPFVSDRFDYEGELAVIIGRAGRHIAREDALAHVAGYTCFNDATLRDWQSHTSQFTPGKNFPRTGALGPWMVSAAAMGPIGPQRIRTTLNGAIVQDATLDQMIFDVPAIIAYCSSFTRLEPGDLIATGTPGGVGSRRQPPLWLKPGDRIEVEIEGIGTLANGVEAEPRS